MRCYQGAGSAVADASGATPNMPRPLRHLLPDSSFLRKWWLLASGTIMGQALVVISSPLLTRLVTPEEFGLFAVFSALVGIAGAAAGLRYEYAVPLAAADEDAAAIAAVVVLTSAALATLAAGLVWLCGGWFVERLDAAPLAPWLWLLPPAIFVWGGGSALSYWSVRHHTYGVSAINRTLQLGAQTAGQLGAAFAGWGAPGLIIGYLLGYLTRLGHYVALLPAADRRMLFAWRWQRWRAVAREHWRYPAFSLPSSLLAQIIQLGPAIIIAAMFGPAVAGFFALAQRVVGLPIRMVSEAAGQVFLGELRGLERPALRRLFRRTVMLFAGLGIAGMLPLLLFAPPLFEFVFGDGWAEGGVLVQLLVPLYIARFIDLPVSQLFNVLNHHQLGLLLTFLRALALVASFSIGAAFALSTFETILIFSVLSTVAYIYRLFRCWQILC
jgi:O-antigen/teichoic acid export membrane protein